MVMTETATNRRRAQPARRDDTIQIRISAQTKAVLNRAAALRGQRLSAFILDSARRQAEEIILDQRAFFLPPEAHDEFLARLDKPAEPAAEVCARLRRKPAWEN